MIRNLRAKINYWLLSIEHAQCVKTHVFSYLYGTRLNDRKLVISKYQWRYLLSIKFSLWMCFFSLPSSVKLNFFFINNSTCFFSNLFICCCDYIHTYTKSHGRTMRNLNGVHCTVYTAHAACLQSPFIENLLIQILTKLWCPARKLAAMMASAA